MLQSINTQNGLGWPSATLNPVVVGAKSWKPGIRNRNQSSERTVHGIDVASLHPKSLSASSDAFSWQDIRVLHLRHAQNEMVVPATDHHCLVLNLGMAIDLK